MLYPGLYKYLFCYPCPKLLNLNGENSIYKERTKCQRGHHSCNRTFFLLPQPNLTLSWKTLSHTIFVSDWAKFNTKEIELHWVYVKGMDM